MVEFWHQIWAMAFVIGIVGNLVASALWAIPALVHLHRKLDRHHKEHLDAIRLGRNYIDGTNGPIDPSDRANVPPSN